MPDFVLAPLPPDSIAPRRDRVVAEHPSHVLHAPSLVEREDGSLLCCWFEGKVEAGSDVRIRGAILMPGGYWGEAFDVTDGAATGRDLGYGVRTVGNPVVFAHPSGEYWLIYPSISLGGWAGSRLNLKRSLDGVEWGPAQRLQVGPFFNLSTLVKAPPAPLDDGTIALPAYHEMIGGFGEMLFIDAAGEVTDKARMGARGLSAIQPWLVPTGPRHALAFCRDLGKGAKRVFVTRTEDAGRHWSAIDESALPNPNSPVAAWRFADGRIGLVFNDGETDRRLLRLAVTEDEGRSFRRAGILFDGREDNRTHRYVFALRGADGMFHLVCSRSTKKKNWSILHVSFGMDAFETGEDAHVA
jgi:predicted neuraminidase